VWREGRCNPWDVGRLQLGFCRQMSLSAGKHVNANFTFLGGEKVVARMLGPFPFPLGSFDVDFGGGFR